MKKFISVMAVVLLFALTPMAMAYTVSTGATYGPYQTGSGGEFTLIPGADLTWVLGGYADTVTKNLPGYNGTFQTFCLEGNEAISTNTTYNTTTIDNAAINGGLGGPSPDPISKGTASLYLQFAQGTLGSYNYGAGRAASAALLQQAIWVLEQEAGALGQGANLFLDSVVLTYNPFPGATYADKLAAAIADNNNGYYNVAVLNLAINGVPEQSQLVVTPIPAAVWLLGTGLVALIGIRRRKNS